MTNLYLYTPLFDNKDFIPHLVEHSVFGRTNVDNFFAFENVSAHCSTYYTYYSIETKDAKEIEKFIDRITSKLDIETIKYEYEVLKKECLKPSYAQKITQGVGKYLYGNDFLYLGTQQLNYDELLAYHQKWYRKENIIILEDNNKFYSDKYDITLNLHNSTELNIEGNKENILIFKHNIYEYYCIFILASLFDYYIKYKLRFEEKTYDYLDFYTLIGDFEDYFYISIHSQSLGLIKEIDDDFINQYIENSIQFEEYLSDINMDGGFLIKHGSTLSSKTKLNILQDIQSIYKIFVSKI